MRAEHEGPAVCPPDPSRRAPELGEHTAEILSAVLHYSDAQIQQMRENQAI